jgi:DNA adenine methylase
MNASRPVLRYYGGKWRLADWIISHFPAHRIYVEPFGGGASVLIQKPRVYAEIYNDLDGEIVNVFRVLRCAASAKQLERTLRLTPFSRNEFMAAYRKSRRPIEQARRTLIKSYMGFGSNGLWSKDATGAGMRTQASTWCPPTGFRSDAKRSGTTPAHDWASWPDQIDAFTQRLSAVVIENRPAEDLIETHDRQDTLHYVDPPYVPETRSSPRQQYRHEMSRKDHERLGELLNAAKGMVVLSGYPSSLYDKQLYSHWHRVERKHLADGARPKIEVLWLNPRASEHQKQLRFDEEQVTA